jgi:PilZ domain
MTALRQTSMDARRQVMTSKRLGDRRYRARFEIVGQQWGALETLEPVALANISRNGALVDSRVPLAPDSVHRVRLSLDGTATEVQARVRHVSSANSTAFEPRYLIGVEFLDVPPSVGEELERLVTAHFDAQAVSSEAR